MNDTSNLISLERQTASAMNIRSNMGDPINQKPRDVSHKDSRQPALIGEQNWREPIYLRFGRRPPFRGRGTASPARGTLNNSSILADSAFAIRSRTATVGFSKPRSSRLTYVRSISASTARTSYESPIATLNRRIFLATRAPAFIDAGQQPVAY
jgi:hypothetical protein